MRIMPIAGHNVYGNSNRHNTIANNINAKPSFCAYLNKDIYERVDAEAFKREYLTPNTYNYLPIHFADLNKTKQIHKVLKKQPELLAQMHLTQGENGRLPIHYADLDKIKQIHRALKKQPEVLAQMHLTRDKAGNLPIHYADLDKIKQIHRALRKQREVLAKIHLTRNNDGNLPIRFRYYKSGEVDTNPDIKAEILGVVHDLATNSNLDIESSIKLLETYKNFGSEFENALEALKLQAAQGK